jgi:phage gp29-like protein
MKWTERIVNALRAGSQDRPKPGQVIYPRREDTVRDYPSAGLTPSRLLAILKEADDGSLSAPMQLFEEMEEKDAHLYAVAHTRRLALTGLEWQVISAADVLDGVDRGAADETAAYCRELLVGLEAFDDVLQHLSLAVGRNIAIAEVIWDVAGGELRPVDLVPIDFTRILFDEVDRPRILTEDKPRDGIELQPNKFIVHTPHSVSGHPQRGGLLRVTAMVYLAKNMALKDWMIFAEVFGMPVRIARYEPNATAEEKRELLTMLESLGSNAAGIFSRAVELQVIEANRGSPGPPYRHLVEFLNREMSKVWLGQTLTTDTTEQGSSFAATRVHEMVRQDVLADDIRKEARTIRRDLLGSITRLRFGPDAPVPYFRRKLKQPADTTQLANVLDVAVNRLGVSVPLGWAHEALGIPQAAGGEATVPGGAE